MQNCNLNKKEDVYSENNSIGINIGGWINMETWIHDTKFYMPQVKNNNPYQVNTSLPNGNNYQRAELATIREVNNQYTNKNNTGNPNLEYSLFNDNIPPTNRIEPKEGGAKTFMSLHWATFLSDLVNDKQSTTFSDIFDDNYNLKKTKEEIFGIILRDDILKRFNLFRIPIGYWAFSKWNSDSGNSNSERSPYEINSEKEPPLWYNNEGFLSGPNGSILYLKLFIELIKEHSPNSKIILDLHALAGVQAANSDFAGWNTSVIGGIPSNKSYIAGTWINNEIINSTNGFIPINNDPNRKNNKINWVYPGPLPGDNVTDTQTTKSVSAYSGFTDWIQYNEKIFERICQWIKDNNYEDMIYGITPANEPSQDSGKMTYSNKTTDILILPKTNGSKVNYSPEGKMYIDNIINYHIKCNEIINQYLPSKNLIVSLITDSFYGNGGNLNVLYDKLIENSNKNIIFDCHRYSNWGFIPSFTPVNVNDSYKSITSNIEGSTENTLSTGGPWTNYSYTDGKLVNNQKQPYKTIIGEWAPAVNNNYLMQNMGTLNDNICGYDNNQKCNQLSTVFKIFNSTLNLWIKNSSPCLIGSSFWMLRVGYGMDYDILNEKISYINNFHGANKSYTWNYCGEIFDSDGNLTNKSVLPGGPELYWNNFNWIWSYVNLARLDESNKPKSLLWNNLQMYDNKSVPSPGPEPGPSPSPSPSPSPPKNDCDKGYTKIEEKSKNYIIFYINLSILGCFIIYLFFTRIFKFNSNKISKIIIFILLLAVTVITFIYPIKKTNTECKKIGPSPSPTPSPTDSSGFFTKEEFKNSNVYLISEDNFDIDKLNNIICPKGQTRVCTYNNGDQDFDFPDNNIKPTTLLFLPGTYNIPNNKELKVGYYSSLIGLGKQSTDVKFKGKITIDKSLLTNTQNSKLGSTDNLFWRSVENITLLDTQTWCVSQSCPFRKLTFEEDLDLGKEGSPGFISNSTIKNNIKTGVLYHTEWGGWYQAVQQYCLKNITCNNADTLRSKSGQYNLVYINPNIKNLSKTELDNNKWYSNKKNTDGYNVIVDDKELNNDNFEKPNLIIDNKNDFMLNLNDNNNNNYYVINSNNFNKLYDIKSNFKPNSSIVILPGKYLLTDSININLDNITLTGLGWVILYSNTQNVSIVLNNNNCILTSVLVDASPLDKKQSVLIEINGDNNKIYDICTRTQQFNDINGVNYKNGSGVDTMMIINGKNNYLEQLWLWRSDKCPSGGEKWPCANHQNLNVNPYGLVVNGDNTKIVALMVEHQSVIPITWNANDGTVYMSQGESAYTPPSSLQNNGYYTLGKNVNNHKLIGGGIYNIFGVRFNSVQNGPAIKILGDKRDLSNFIFRDTIVASWAGDGGPGRCCQYWGCILDAFGTKYGPNFTQPESKFIIKNSLENLNSYNSNNIPGPGPGPGAGPGPGPKSNCNQCTKKNIDSNCCDTDNNPPKGYSPISIEGNQNLFNLTNKPFSDASDCFNQLSKKVNKGDLMVNFGKYNCRAYKPSFNSEDEWKKFSNNLKQNGNRNFSYVNEKCCYN